MDNCKLKKIFWSFAFFSVFAAIGIAHAQAEKTPLPQSNPTVIPGPQLGLNFQVTNNKKPTITGTVNNPEATIYVAIGDRTFRGINNGDGSWAAGISKALEDGTYDVSVIAGLPLGGKAVLKAASALKIDTIAPKITVDDLTTGDSSPALTGTIDDTTAVIAVDVEGKPYGATNNQDGTWTLPAKNISPDLKPGPHKITALAGDLAGNLSTAAEGTLTIENKEAS